MLGQRRRRWDNVSPTVVQCFVFAGFVVIYLSVRIPSTILCGQNIFNKLGGLNKVHL